MFWHKKFLSSIVCFTVPNTTGNFFEAFCIGDILHFFSSHLNSSTSLYFFPGGILYCCRCFPLFSCSSLFCTAVLPLSLNYWLLAPLFWCFQSLFVLSFVFSLHFPHLIFELISYILTL